MLFVGKPEVVVKKVIKGVSLIELLISLSLGSFILFMASQLFSDVYVNQHKQSELFKLQKSAHQILDYLQQHIIHTGFQGKQRVGSNFALFMADNRPYVVEKNCLVIMQDLNGDGCLGKRAKQCATVTTSFATDVLKEILAVKVENKTLMVLSKYNRFTECTKSECAKLLQGCDQLKWEKIAEVSDSDIEQLEFSWEKEPELLKIALKIASQQNPNIVYEAVAYSYLLNGNQ